ncbi:VanZ family protein [Nitriliruptoraceae bacterium ZYF776]|nr:VanZ family protein [Profundirhabdus halotolerans]
MSSTSVVTWRVATISSTQARACARWVSAQLGSPASACTSTPTCAPAGRRRSPRSARWRTSPSRAGPRERWRGGGASGGLRSGGPLAIGGRSPGVERARAARARVRPVRRRTNGPSRRSGSRRYRHAVERWRRCVVVAQALAAALVVGLAVTVGSGLVRAATGTRRTFGAAALDGALIGSLAGVAVATLYPLDRFGELTSRPEIQLVPLERLDGAPIEFAVINVLLLVPTVLLLAQRWRSVGVVRLTLLAGLLSCLIEGAQLFHPERGTNVDDLILNTVGAAGAAIVGVTVRWARGRSLRRATPPRSPLEAELDTWGSSDDERPPVAR